MVFKTQYHALFPYESCCNAKAHNQDQVILGTNTLQIIWKLFFKKNMWLSFVYGPQLKFFRRQYRKKLTFTRPKLSENQKNRSITPGSWGEGDLCKSQTPVLRCTLWFFRKLLIVPLILKFRLSDYKNANTTMENVFNEHQSRKNVWKNQ